MAPTPEDFLRSVDPRLGEWIDLVIERTGRQRYRPSPFATHFEALVRSIVFQQLSGRAAATIFGRLVECVEGVLEPERLLEVEEEVLRDAGLSRAKIRYVRALARAVAGGELDLSQVESMSDEEVIASLTRVDGVGVWTAQMFLMFRLRRPDVLPTGDLGIRKGLQLAHGLRKPAAPGYVQRAGARWRPHRSLACLYLWAALEVKALP